MISVGELKFEVVTSNRTFIFRAESDGGNMTHLHSIQMCLELNVLLIIFFHTFLHTHSVERNEWVTALQDCTRGRNQHNTMTHGSLLNPDYQGFLEYRGLRSKLYIVVASDKVFLFKNMEVRTTCVILRRVCKVNLH